MKQCTADDGETYYEIKGMWYKITGGRMESASKPKILISCKILDVSKEKDFFTKHLIKEKGQN